MKYFSSAAYETIPFHQFTLPYAFLTFFSIKASRNFFSLDCPNWPTDTHVIEFLHPTEYLEGYS